MLTEEHAASTRIKERARGRGEVRINIEYDKIPFSTMSMTKRSRHPVASFLGKGYAHVQHGIDQLTEWGVAKLKQAEAHDIIEVETKATHTRGRYLRSAEKVVRSTFGFIGTFAESYFDKYRQLKTNQSKAGKAHVDGKKSSHP